MLRINYHFAVTFPTRNPRVPLLVLLLDGETTTGRSLRLPQEYLWFSAGSEAPAFLRLPYRLGYAVSGSDGRRVLFHAIVGYYGSETFNVL